MRNKQTFKKRVKRLKNVHIECNSNNNNRRCKVYCTFPMQCISCIANAQQQAALFCCPHTCWLYIVYYKWYTWNRVLSVAAACDRIMDSCTFNHCLDTKVYFKPLGCVLYQRALCGLRFCMCDIISYHLAVFKCAQQEALYVHNAKSCSFVRYQIRRECVNNRQATETTRSR